jgi:hypothetical protein
MSVEQGAEERWDVVIPGSALKSHPETTAEFSASC